MSTFTTLPAVRLVSFSNILRASVNSDPFLTNDPSLKRPIELPTKIPASSLSSSFETVYLNVAVEPEISVRTAARS